MNFFVTSVFEIWTLFLLKKIVDPFRIVLLFTNRHCFAKPLFNLQRNSRFHNSVAFLGPSLRWGSIDPASRRCKLHPRMLPRSAGRHPFSWWKRSCLETPFGKRFSKCWWTQLQKRSPNKAVLLKCFVLEVVPIVEMRFLLFGRPVMNLELLRTKIEAQETFIDGTN